MDPQRQWRKDWPFFGIPLYTWDSDISNNAQLHSLESPFNYYPTTDARDHDGWKAKRDWRNIIYMACTWTNTSHNLNLVFCDFHPLPTDKFGWKKILSIYYKGDASSAINENRKIGVDQKIQACRSLTILRDPPISPNPRLFPLFVWTHSMRRMRYSWRELFLRSVGAREGGQNRVFLVLAVGSSNLGSNRFNDIETT